MPEAQETEVVYRDNSLYTLLEFVEMLQGHFYVIDRDPILKEYFQALVNYLYSSLGLDDFEVHAEEVAFWVSPVQS